MATTGTHLSLNTIAIQVKEHLHRTRQVVFAKAAQANAKERQDFLAHVSNFDDPAVFIGVDETHRNKDEIRKRAYLARGGRDPDVSKYFDPSGGVSSTLIAAANIDGFELRACRLVQRSRDHKDLDPTHGTVDSEAFIQYIREDLAPILGKFPAPNSVVLMDNASTHKDPVIREMIEAVGAFLFYTPACSPDMIFIEYDFRIYKTYLRRHSLEMKEDAMQIQMQIQMQIHLEALASVTYEKQCNIFNHIGCFQNVPVPQGKRGPCARAATMAAVVVARNAKRG